MNTTISKANLKNDELSACQLKIIKSTEKKNFIPKRLERDVIEDFSEPFLH